jgi:hypothetical protein
VAFRGGGGGVASGSAIMRRRVTRILLIALLGAAVVAAAAAVTYATGVWWPLSAGTQAQVEQAIVGFESARSSERPAGMVGRRLTKADRAALQARFLQRLQRYATGPALAWGDTWDYAAALRDDEWDARELVGVSGRIVYWDGPRGGLGGRAHVKAGVERRYQVVTWDEASGKAVPQQEWITGVVVKDYALRRVDGVWKVADTSTWRFFDPATGRLSTGP